MSYNAQGFSLAVHSLEDHLHTVLEAHPSTPGDYLNTLKNVAEILYSLGQELEDGIDAQDQSESQAPK
jgi:nitrate reductase assembly molybdenum cofactor insertion protein NarJ